jgi:1-acyl-sn-glycerol-3-phosphate acyltransferase
MWLIPVIAVLALAISCRWRASQLHWADFLMLGACRAYASFWQRCRRSKSPLPRHGPALIVVNHSCSADPAFRLNDSPRVLSFVTTRQHYNLHPLVKRLMDHAGCVPILRGGHDPVGVRLALKRLTEGRVLVIFPEGNLSGVVTGRMRRWKYGAAYLALKSGVPVYPVWIEGGPRTDQLARAWLRRSGRATRVHYGCPVDLAAYQGSRITRPLLEQVTELLMRSVTQVRPPQKPGDNSGPNHSQGNRIIL